MWHTVTCGTACYKAWGAILSLVASPPPAPTLRERNRRRIRDALVAAGLTLFAERGYAATSVEAIAEAAGVSRRTFFRYFADKDELVFADDEEHVAAVLAAVDAAPPHVPALEVVHLAGQALAELLVARRELATAYGRLVASVPGLRARSLAKQHRWEALIAERLARRPGVTAGEAALAAKVGVACVQAALEPWLEAPETDLTAAIDAAFAALAGLVGPASLSEPRDGG